MRAISLWLSLLSVDDLSIAEMNFDTEQLDHRDCPLGICWIGDECTHVWQLETASDLVCFRFGRNVGLGEEETVDMKAKEGESSVAGDHRYSKTISDGAYYCVLFVSFNR